MTESMAPPPVRKPKYDIPPPVLKGQPGVPIPKKGAPNAGENWPEEKEIKIEIGGERLTVREATAVLAFTETASMAKAAAVAFAADPAASDPKDLRVKAYKLFRQEHIQRAIAGVFQTYQDSIGNGKAYIIQQLSEIVAEARAGGEPMAAVAALKEMKEVQGHKHTAAKSVTTVNTFAKINNWTEPDARRAMEEVFGADAADIMEEAEEQVRVRVEQYSAAGEQKDESLVARITGEITPASPTPEGLPVEWGPPEEKKAAPKRKKKKATPSRTPAPSGSGKAPRPAGRVRPVPDS